MSAKDELILHPDFRDMLEALIARNVEFVIVGAFALAQMGFPRGTGDLDIWVRPTEPNATAVLGALNDFGFESLQLKQSDIFSGDVIQLGFPPVRIDLLTRLTGLDNEQVWSSRVPGKINGYEVGFLNRELFIINKQKLGRPKDNADLKSLGL